MFSYDLDTSEISIYDELGPAWWGLIDAQTVTNALDQMKGKHVTVRLNTPGGSVDEGIAIYNALTRHKGGVTTVVDSLAASMGSYLLQAGEERRVASNAMVMIHDPWTITMGNATALRKDAETLDKYALRMIPDYAKRSGKSDDDILAIMAEESWYAGREAVDAGFADSVEEYAQGRSVQPVMDSLHRFCSKIPDSLKQLRKDNQAARLDDSLLSVGIDRKCLSTTAAKKMSAKVADMCKF
jgi:ATP-dependent Clp endopeptidase proteolytic subunit ClpP